LLGLVDDDCASVYELDLGLTPAARALIDDVLTPEGRVNMVDLVVL
jgi:hypothetical protein